MPARVVSLEVQAELRAMFTEPDGSMRDHVIVDRYPTRLAQDLMLVESGPVWTGIKIEWPAPADPEFRLQQVGMPRYAVRLSHYGRQVLGLERLAIPAA